MITALIYLGCAFLYFQIGCWLGRLYYWTWHVNDRKNRLLAWLLFPVATAWDGKKGDWCPGDGTAPPLLVDYFVGETRRCWYIFLKGFLWPLGIVTSATGLLIGVAHYALSGRAKRLCIPHVVDFLGFLFFSMLDGPVASWRRYYGKPEVAPVEEQVRVAPEVAAPESMDPLATDDDRARAARYKALSTRRDQLKAELFPGQDELVKVETEMAQIEADDAAAHSNGYRDRAQEARLQA